MMHLMQPSFSLVARVLLILAAVLGSAASASAGDAWTAVTSPQRSSTLCLLKDGKQVLQFSAVGWGKNWSYFGNVMNESVEPKDGVVTWTADIKTAGAEGPTLTVAGRMEKSDAKTLKLQYDLSTKNDLELTQVVLSFSNPVAPEGSQLVLTGADGKEQIFPIPVPSAIYTGPITKAAFRLKGIGEIFTTYEPACEVHMEGNNFRLRLVRDKLPAGKKSITMTLATPAPLTFEASKRDHAKYIVSLPGADWFKLESPAQPLTQPASRPCPLDMSAWLDAPAGKHGPLQMKGDKFVFADNKPVKIWGTNLSYAAGCAPDKATAESLAARFAFLGLNSVRLHKFTHPADTYGVIDPDDATKYLPEGLDRMDYFCAKLAEKGVYYGFSHTFGLIVGKNNKGRLLAYDEISRQANASTYALMNYAEDCQDLLIERTVALLKHKNPYTGKTYAEDPALQFVELQNEDNIFFWTTAGAVENYPTYKKHLMGRWADWLKEKYKTREALAKAWQGWLKDEETFEAKNIAMESNPWYFSSDVLPYSLGAQMQRRLDNAEFFHDVQNRFYSRFVKAIRDAGFKGPLCGSPWQTAGGIPNYYNLRSDALVGFIDRHNYSGGAIAAADVRGPGTGALSIGLQQVSDRPFTLSEWISVYPAQATAEAPAIVACYGLGLQGWDASWQFQSWIDRTLWADQAGRFPWGVWEADLPAQLGQSPTLARMLYRGDIKEGNVISTLRVSMDKLRSGQLDFKDVVQSTGDIKRYGGSVPPEALAAGRCVVEFTATSQPSSLPDMGKHVSGSVVKANNGQLAWDGSNGYFTVDTEGTKGVCGFAGGRTLTLGKVTIAPKTEFASVFLTAAGPKETLANAKSAILSAVARTSNKGFRYFAVDGTVLDNGTGPAYLEPVKATITIDGRAIEAVNVLDHQGCRTGKTLEIRNGAFTIDGAATKAFYYEIVFRR